MGFCCRWAFPTLGMTVLSGTEATQRDDRADRNGGYAKVPLSMVIQWVVNAQLQQKPHIGFFFLHNTTEKLPFTLFKVLFFMH